MKTDIMTLLFDNITLQEAVDTAISCAKANENCMVVTPNAEIAYRAKTDARLKAIINSAKLVLPDGVGVVLASKIIGKPLKGKVAGVEFAEQLVAQTNLPIFLLGGKPGVADLAAKNLKAKYPTCNICGTADGYFKEDGTAIDAVNASGAKIVLVCLGAPRQEFFIDDNKDKLMPAVMAGLGGSLDVFAGTVKRAPDIFVKLGLEWFYRLLKQPSRFKRMLSLPLYAWDSVVWKFRGKSC